MRIPDGSSDYIFTICLFIEYVYSGHGPPGGPAVAGT